MEEACKLYPTVHVHGGIASLMSCRSSLGKCFCAREKTVVELLIWRCLHKVSILFFKDCTLRISYLLINVVTSLSSMVLRPACLEYAAKSSPTCSKYQEDACSIAARVCLLIFAFDPARPRAN